jgi:hypothetical protein
MQTTVKQTKPFCTFDGASIFTIRADELGEFWPTIIKFLGMIDADWTTDQVYEAIKDKKAQVWGMVDGGVVTVIWITRIEKARDLYGLVWIAAGQGLEKGLPLFLSETERWFKEMGCKEVRLLGRRGWKRVLPGYEESRIELRKKL